MHTQFKEFSLLLMLCETIICHLVRISSGEPCFVLWIILVLIFCFSDPLPSLRYNCLNLACFVELITACQFGLNTVLNTQTESAPAFSHMLSTLGQFLGTILHCAD